MNIDFNTFFPDGIADETAVAIRNLLHQLLFAWEATYFNHLQRHTTPRQLELYVSQTVALPPKTPPRPKSR